MNRSTRSLAAAILTIATLPTAAQWLNVPTKGIPRAKDGKPALTAPAPRKPDGKPDLSGIWMVEDGKYTLDLAADFNPDELVYVRNGQGLIVQPDLAADFKPGELPIQPWAEALTNKKRYSSNWANAARHWSASFDSDRLFTSKITRPLPSGLVACKSIAAGISSTFVHAASFRAAANVLKV